MVGLQNEKLMVEACDFFLNRGLDVKNKINILAE
jgi:hypothetical protein